MDKDRVLASIRVAEAYCYDAGGANAARNCKEARTAVAEATWRLSKKLDVLELARVIGHRDVRSLLLYYSTSADDLADRL